MKLGLALLLSALTAILAAPAEHSQEALSGPAWPEAVVRAASLGRTYAGVDVVWLKTVQIIGSEAMTKAGFPRLDEWVDVATRLDPEFVEPYFFGVILLVTDESRAAQVDALLARGEATMPDTFTLPMYRGFIAYFGRLDPAAAAEHYERAASKAGAPVYLKPFAARLRTEEQTCSGMMRDLQEVSADADGARRRALESGRLKVLEHCLRIRIERVANSYRVRTEKTPSIGALVSAGLLDPARDLLAPPGRCWSLDPVTTQASLGPCPGGSSTP